MANLKAKTWHDSTRRLGGLRRFALSITLFNIIGHFFLGFEQSWAHPLVALATGYTLSIVFEVVFAWSRGRQPIFLTRGGTGLIDFLLPSHIAALAISMLLYPNERLAPIMFAVAVALGSKVLFRISVGKGSRHILNPSNFGIAVTLFLFPWVSISPPYQFTENISGIANWIIPLGFVLFGTFLNGRFTKRLPLIAAWVSAFALQALIRALIFGTPLMAGLMPITGVAFLLYTFYMISDPATTPQDTRSQVMFGVSVAAVYALLMTMHIVFGLFFALPIVCLLRSAGILASQWYRANKPEPIVAQSPA